MSGDTCRCPLPVLTRVHRIVLCARCQRVPRPPSHVPPPDVLNAWVAHSVKMGMSVERIAADLGVSVAVVEIVR